MLRSFLVLLVALTASSIASALPPQALEEADAAVPVVPTSTGYTPTATADLFILPLLDSRDKDGGKAAETVHTEETAVLALPTFGDGTTSTYYTPFQALATPTAPSRIGPKPQLPHVESTQSELMGPSPQVTSTNEVNQPPVKATPQVADTQTTAAAPESPIYNAPAPTTQDNKAYDNGSSSPTTASAPANSAPAPTAGPSLLYNSVSGALGLVAGSTGVVVSGTTYSLAAGGSALYINGVSSSIDGKSVQLSNGLTLSVSSAPSSTGTTLKSVVASSKTVLVVSPTSSGNPLATGAAPSIGIAHKSLIIGLSIALAGILA